jgi:hypothetical protein
MKFARNTKKGDQVKKYEYLNRMKDSVRKRLKTCKLKNSMQQGILYIHIIKVMPGNFL